MKIGIVAKWLSILSNKPPWPGIRLEASFTSTTLLNKLMTASPITATKEATSIKIIYSEKFFSTKLEVNTKIIKGVKVIAIKNPSTVLFGLTLCKSLVFPNRFPPKKAKVSIKTLIKTIIKRAVLFVISIPKYIRSDSFWLIKKYKEAKKPRWINAPEISQTIFLCIKGLLMGKLIIRKKNPKYASALRLIKILLKAGNEAK